jgi:hypothetical protein
MILPPHRPDSSSSSYAKQVQRVPSGLPNSSGRLLQKIIIKTKDQLNENPNSKNSGGKRHN